VTNNNWVLLRLDCKKLTRPQVVPLWCDLHAMMVDRVDKLQRMQREATAKVPAKRSGHNDARSVRSSAQHSNNRSTSRNANGRTTDSAVPTPPCPDYDNMTLAEIKALGDDALQRALGKM
jgi:hypothetical protein